MTYVAPALKGRFESLSEGLRNMILERNTQINTMQDFIKVLEDIVDEAEQEDN
jgi:hypothetical protein